MIVVEKTAIFSKTITKRQTSIINFFTKNNITSITDIGSGRLRLVQFYVENGVYCNLVETQKQIDNLYRKETPTQELLCKLQAKGLIGDIYSNEEFEQATLYSDAITCSFVLCVMPHKEKRDNLVSLVYTKLKKGQFALFEVRSSKDIERIDNKVPQYDGYIVGNGKEKTFQKGYTKDELISYIESFGFQHQIVFENSNSVSVLFEKA